jgi:hypothetical protein
MTSELGSSLPIYVVLFEAIEMRGDKMEELKYKIILDILRYWLRSSDISVTLSQSGYVIVFLTLNKMLLMSS